MRVVLVAGARPNFMKIAPILHEMWRHPHHFQPVFIHTGQHYDDEMSQNILNDLGLPEPDFYLGAGSGSHAVQTSKVMMAFENVVLEDKPDLVVVVGDVNSTLACAIVSSKLHIPVAHVEAGLRSFDRTMPEEVNRVLTDQLSDFLLIPCEDAMDNLVREGVDPAKIHFVGNVMIESLMTYRSKVEDSSVLERFNLTKNDYVLTTLHRPSNVDDEETFRSIMEGMCRIQQDIPIVFPAHPRTQAKMEAFGLKDTNHRLLITESLGYQDFLALEMNARFVITDSGGIQEETTIFGVPCLTVRKNTERPITVTEGTNILVDPSGDAIVEESLKILGGSIKTGRIPRFWDDQVSRRIVKVFMESHLS